MECGKVRGEVFARKHHALQREPVGTVVTSLSAQTLGEFYVSHNRCALAGSRSCRCRSRKFQFFVAIADHSPVTYLRRDAGRLIRLPFVEGSGGTFLPLFCPLPEIYISPARGFRKACWHCFTVAKSAKGRLHGDPDYTTHSFAMSCRPIRSCSRSKACKKTCPLNGRARVPSFISLLAWL